MRNSALRKKFNFYFQGVSARIDKIFFLGGRLGTRLYFHEVLILSSGNETFFGGTNEILKAIISGY